MSDQLGDILRDTHKCQASSDRLEKIVMTEAAAIELTIKLADPYRGRKYCTASQTRMGGRRYHPRIAKRVRCCPMQSGGH